MRFSLPTVLAFLMLSGPGHARSPEVDDDLPVRQAVLVDALACGNAKVTANQVAGMVYAVGGHSPVLGADHSLFTWPHPVLVFGEKVDRMSITARSTEDGDFFTTAVAFPGEDLTAIAQRAQMTFDIDGIYRRWNGASELTLQVENGVPVMICAPNVNNWPVRVRRFFRESFRDS